PPTQIGPGNDMDMIKSYGGAEENQQSSTIQGSSLVTNTVPSNEINKNPETESKSMGD
ncbi:unnamed protein product, partial [Adineta steineri]